MFFVWGNTWKYKTKGNGLRVNKTCPECNRSGEFFEVIPSKYFTLFWIPLVATETKNPLLECPHCHQRLYIQQNDYNNAIKGFSESKLNRNNDDSNCIIFQCENCAQKLRIPIKNKLLKITCPVCKKIFYFNDGKQTYNSGRTFEEKTVSEKPKTKVWDQQQRLLKFISDHRKEIVCVLVVIGVFILLLIAPTNSVKKVEKVAPPSTITHQQPSVAPLPKPEVSIDLEPVNPNRLRTGAVPFKGVIRSGHSQITVDNGTDTDAIVRIMRFNDNGQQNIRNFYVRSQNKFVANQIPPGEYILRVAFGTDWNSDTRKFNYRKSFSKTQTFTIEETKWTEQTDDGKVEHTRSSKQMITLHKVLHGNFKSYPINEEEFWQ